MRTRRTVYDVCYIVGYFPPSYSSKQHKGLYQEMLRWLGGLFASLPARCTVVLLCDANAHVGMKRVDGVSQTSASSAIGAAEPRQENAAGTA